MKFQDLQQQQMFAEDVRSRLRPYYIDTAGNRLTACVASVLMKDLRGRNPAGCRGDQDRSSELESGRMWKVPSRPAAFADLLKICGFDLVQGYGDVYGTRRGPTSGLVVEKQS